MSAGALVREAESRALRAFLTRAQAEPAALLVEGEAGIGKTTLLWEAAGNAASQGFAVLTAGGAPTEVRYAYGAIADLLTTVGTGIRADLPGEHQAALEGVLLGSSDGPASNERMVAAAFLSVLHRLSSDAPVLLGIDDAQWLDASSRAVIGFAARRLTGRVGILVTVRTGDPDSSDMTWLSFARPDSLARLRISALSLGGVHTLISAQLGRTLPRPMITRIHEISGGNPFFALELARFAAAEPTNTAVGLPESLAALVQDHLGQPDEELATVLLAAACAAVPSVERVGRASGVDPDRVVELIESPPAGDVVEVDGNRIRFRHPLFATGVYGSASRAARRAVHRRLAEIVEEPELKARHLALAATTGDPDTLKALDAAVEVTQARGAPVAAAELLELAIKLGDDTPMRRMRAAEQHFRSGAIEPARNHLRTALAGLPATGALRCMALIALAAVTGYDESVVDAADLLNQAVSAADNPVLQLHARLLLVPITGLIGDLRESVEGARVALALAEQLGVVALHSQALAIQAMVNFMYGLGVDQPALQLALKLEDPASGASGSFQASAVAAVIAGWTGELDAACTQLDAVQQRFRRNGTEIDILWAAEHLTMIQLWLGRYADAAATAEDAMQRAEQMGGGYLLGSAWRGRAEVAAYTGRAEEVRRATDAIREAAQPVGAGLLVDRAATTLGFLEVSLGNYPAALAALAPLLESFDAEHGTEIPVGVYLPDAIEALTALGRIDEAEPLIAALERNGARHDRPWMLAMGARGRSHWLAAGGDLDAAEQAAIQALGHHERLPMPFEAARTQLLLGGLQRRRRRKQAAEATLREALETFERLGAPLWAQRARAELDRLTAPVRGAGLTAAERRVADRAAAGMSNKEIAAELFIAAKTVEMTLSAVYRKLGIRSRAGLFAALHSIDVQGKP